MITEQIYKARQAQKVAQMRRHFMNGDENEAIMIYVQSNLPWSEFNRARSEGIEARNRRQRGKIQWS